MGDDAAKLFAKSANAQGHTPLHKAAWGGHPCLCRWLISACGASDDVRDSAGGLAADAARMAGHRETAALLHREGDPKGRALARKRLGGLDEASSRSADRVRAAFRAVARASHPDRAPRMAQPAAAGQGGPEAFVAAREARDFLLARCEAGDAAGTEGPSPIAPTGERTEGDAASERGPTGPKPTHSLPLLLRAVRARAEAQGAPPASPTVALLRAQILSAVLEHEREGLPLAQVRKKYRQVWQTEMPSEEKMRAMGIGLPRGGRGLAKMLSCAVFRPAFRVVRPRRRADRAEGKCAGPRLFSRVSSAEVAQRRLCDAH
jgi:hypothetical protein